MRIQNNHAVPAYRSAGTIGSSQAWEMAQKMAQDNCGGLMELENKSDQATISAAAVALSASETNSYPTRTPGQQKLLAKISFDPVGAEKIAANMATISSQVTFDISSGEIRLASTGQSMEDESVRNAYVKNFEREASRVDSGVRDIYFSEKEKGTDPVQIVAKMIDFKNSQSSGYLEATGFCMV